MAIANTILAGAQKSGTTTLCRFLAAHPNCLVSTPKESNFFSRAANVTQLESYRRYFRAAGPAHQIRVDGTTTYMADCTVARRIRDALGDDTKIILVLRSPAARSYSSFLHMLKRGHERRTADEVFLGLPDDPAEALAAEQVAVNAAAARGRVAARPYRKLYDDVLWNYRYVGNSRYSSLVQAYEEVFRHDYILILYFEDIVRDIGAGRETLAAFLNVDPSQFPETLSRDNRTYIPDLSSPWGWLAEQARWIKRRNFTLVRPREIAASPTKPSEAVSNKLRHIFADEVAYWSKRSGRDLSAIGW